jgi:hypothetical protein
MKLQELLWPLVHPQLLLPNDNAKRHQGMYASSLMMKPRTTTAVIYTVTTANTATMIKHYEGSSCQTIMSTKAVAVLANPRAQAVAQQLRAQAPAQQSSARAVGAAAFCTACPHGAWTGSCGLALRRSASLLLFVSSCHFAPSRPSNIASHALTLLIYLLAAYPGSAEKNPVSSRRAAVMPKSV